MVEREEASVVFQGRKAGASVRRLFSRDGIDDGAIDSAELFTHEHGRPVNRRLIVEPDPAMGRKRSAANFIRSIEGIEKPLNSPDQAVSLMKIIDAAYNPHSRANRSRSAENRKRSTLCRKTGDGGRYRLSPRAPSF